MIPCNGGEGRKFKIQDVEWSSCRPQVAMLPLAVGRGKSEICSVHRSHRLALLPFAFSSRLGTVACWPEDLKLEKNLTASLADFQLLVARNEHCR